MNTRRDYSVSRLAATSQVLRLKKTGGDIPILQHARRLARFTIFLVLIALLALPLYKASSASSTQATRRGDSQTSASTSNSDQSTATLPARQELLKSSRLPLDQSYAPDPLTFSLPLPPAGEAIATYAPDCATPKNTFNLGDQVCVIVSGAPLGKRRINWVNPAGIVLQKVEITSDPQTHTFTLPTDNTTDFGGILVDNRGTWRVNITSKSDASVKARAFFTVKDPDNAVADLSISNAGLGSEESPVASDADVVYVLTITNRGPDAAQNVQVVNAVPANTTFVSQTQDSGPTFNCTNPAANASTGSSTCTISTMAKDQVAILRFTYHVSAGTPNGTIISDTATVSSATAERHPPDNTATATNTVSPVACRIVCPSDIAQDNDPNSGGAIVTYPNATTEGTGCGTLQYSQPSGSFFPVGTTSVVVTSESGSPCSFTVTINDTETPTISCPSDVTVQESSPGSGSATVNYPDPVVTDNDPNATFSCDKPSGSTFNEGTTPVTCIATDSSGNTSQSCTFNVTVTGQGGGCNISCPTNITQNVDAGSCGAVVTYNAPTTSECTDETVTQTAGLASGSIFPVGTTTNTFKVVDSSNVERTCSFTVTVVDNEAPAITCPADIVANATGGTCSANVNITPPTGTDNCSGPVTVTGVRSDFRPLSDPYPASTIITWTAKDAAGNESSCEQIVRVKDNTPPTVVVNVPNNLVEDLLSETGDGSCLAEIPDLVQYVITTDSCTPSSALTVRQTPVPGTLVGPGQHQITITVIEGDPEGDHNIVTATTLNGVTGVDDGNGNITYTINRTLPMVVTVTDTTAPTITAPPDATYQCASEVPQANPNQATAADNCGTPNVTVTETSSGAGTPASPLVIQRTFTATDGANLTASATQTITVIDTTPPVITCPANQEFYLPLNTTGISMNVDYTDATAADNCSTALVVSTPAPNSVFGVGTTTVNSTATDAAGNSSSCSFTVTVRYNFTGFFSPVNNLPVMNVVNAGKGIPVKFSLSGNKGLSIFETGYPASGVIACNTTDPAVDLDATVTAGSSSLSYDAASDQYSYVWKTESSWAGSCRQLVIKLKDGKMYRANFKFK
jgi:uncharacterized repeat protein (TIGR01451 family)